MTASATPILDREAPVPPPSDSPQAETSPRPRRNKIIGVAIVVVFVLLIALLDASPQEILQGKAPIFIALWVLLKFVLVVFSTVVIHELGHLISGWVMGLRFNFVRVGPIHIESPFRVSLKRYWRTGVSGLTSMVPASARAVRTRMFFMTLGGPTANLLSAFAVPLLVSSNSPYLSVFTAVSIMEGIGNLIPFRRGRFASDGRRILMLLRPDALGRRRLAMIKIYAQLARGVSAEEISSSLLSDATSVSDNSFETVIAYQWAYRASWNVAQEAEIARLLEIALQHCNCAPRSFRESLFGDAGIFQAAKRKNLELARQWLAEIPETTSSPWVRLWTESVLLDAEGNIQGALHKLDEIEKIMQRQHPDETISISMRKWRAELLEKLDTRQATATAQ